MVAAAALLALRDGDLPAAAALHGRCFPHEPWSAAALSGLLADPGTVGLLAPGPHGPAGFALVRGVAGEAEILTLCVAPEARRGGIGRALVEGACHLSAALGAAVLHLEVAADNPAAQALYAACGFAQVGRRPGYYRLADGRAMDALLYSRALEG